MSSAPTPSAVETAKQATAKRLRRRYREERRFRFYGVAAIVFAITSLCVLLSSIVGNSLSAFTKNELLIQVELDPALIDPSGVRDPVRLRASVSAFSDLFRAELRERFPDVEDDRTLRRQLARMVSTLSGGDLARRVSENPSLVGQTIEARAPVSDLIDLYLKGLITPERLIDGAATASITREADGQILIRAQQGFASVHEDMAGRIREQAVRHENAAAVVEAGITRTDQRLANSEAHRTALLAADRARLLTEAETLASTGEQQLVAIARAAGRAQQSGDVAPLRLALAGEIQRRATTADSEARELVKRGADYGRKAATALARGEPSAETRRIQSQTAYLAGDRRRVDAELLRAREAALGSSDAEALLAQASLLLERPLGPLAEVAGIETGALESNALRQAVSAMNRAELVAAETVVADQQRRIEALRVEAGKLQAVSQQRAEALIATAVPAAESRLGRLERDAEFRRESRTSLEGLAPADPVAAPVDPLTFAASEAEAQLGLDLGGPFAVAYALGSVDAGAPVDALRQLLAAHAGRESADARRDREVLTRKRDREAGLAAGLRAQVATAGATLILDEFAPSLLVEIDGGVVKATSASPDMVRGVALIPLQGADGAPAGKWAMRELLVGEGDRLVSDRQVAWANALEASGAIRQRLNFDLLQHADSTYPDLAGLAAALAGSFWIMVVTLALSLPIGVMAAIYLEEFAPRNRVTDFIEVNINNLAAVPSIVFGLLGAAVFINFFDLPRSAPFVGGLVLSLITLPTIIIATRAALGAVPPSIREGALAVGASLPQTVFHHVLPLAAPGILTGAIIGLARALGETAPLLLIGMVAFVAQPPATMFDSATALPVLVYKWSSAAERAWQPMTSAAIIVLLLFMFAMNALAVYLRRRLERRW